MAEKKTIFVIIGSAGEHSSNEQLMNHFGELTETDFELTIFTGLKSLPHFDPQLSVEQTPQSIIDFRNAIEKSDGVIICTPEYVFSIPAGLKNALEWCVSTTIFSEKPTGIITASASGEKGHEELQLILKTLGAQFTGETTLLIPGIKGKINAEGELTDSETAVELARFADAFNHLILAHFDKLSHSS